MSTKIRWIYGLAALVLGLLVVGCVQTLDQPQQASLSPVKSGSSSPDILVIGDSQISYGAGKFHLDFFNNLETRCRPNTRQRQALKKLGNGNTAAIGVRSSSLHTWTLPGEQDKAMVCEADEKFGVNAGAYGIANNPGRKYVQIGQGQDYQFCKPGQSPFQAMFANGYYNPKLFVMAFLGNSTDRWEDNAAQADADAQRALKQIPAHVPCIYMTTAPSFHAHTNARRERAQSNIRAAFAKYGNRCSFVSGLTPQTLSAATGNEKFFRTNSQGEVTDPHHPNQEAARTFFDLKRSDMCSAVFEQLEKPVGPSG